MSGSISQRIVKKPLKTFKTLLWLLLITGVTTETVKFGSRHLSFQCESLGAELAATAIKADLQAIEIELLERKTRETAGLVSEFAKENDTPASQATLVEVREALAEISEERAALAAQRADGIPEAQQRYEDVCSDAYLIEGAANFLSGLFNIGLALFLFLLGAFVSLALSRNEDSENA